MERSSLFEQFSPKDVQQWFEAWFEAVRTPFTITESNAWSISHRKIKPLKVPGIKADFKPHTQLLNECMDAANKLFSSQSTTETDKENCKISSSSSPSSKSTTSAAKRLSELLLESELNVPYQNRKAQVWVGYAVPYLFIPGLKIVFHHTRKEVYVEVLDNVGLSSNYHNFKMRLMDKMNYTYIKVLREEIQDLDIIDITNLLEARMKTIVK